MQLSLQQGLLVLVAGSNVLRFAPSLLIDDDDLNQAMQRLQIAIESFISE